MASSFELHLNLSSISFALIAVLATYLTNLCFTPPNPAPDRDRPGKDSLASSLLLSLLWVYRCFMLSSGLAQALFSVFRPTEPSALCPAPQHVTWMLFEWNVYTASFIPLIFLGAAIRLTAYRQLGKDFTYQLATPSGLVTGGLYKYVRHPSYTAAIIVSAGILPTLARLDGVYGCFIPPSLQSFGTAGEYAVIIYILFIVFPRRVVEEEQMMGKSFGKEYEDYMARTWRFVPFVY